MILILCRIGAIGAATAACLALSFVPCDPAHAGLPPGERFQYGADLSLDSRYIWRGVIRSDEFTTGLDAYLGYSQGRTILTAGLWTAAYDHGASSDDSSHHLGHALAGELEGWIQLEAPLGRSIFLSVGTIATWFRKHEDVRSPTEARDVTRLYVGLKARLPGSLRRLTPGLSVESEPSGHITPRVTATLLWQVPFLPHYFFPIGSLYLDGELGYGPLFDAQTGPSELDYGRTTLTLPLGTFPATGLDMDLGVKGGLHWIRGGNWRDGPSGEWNCEGTVSLTMSLIKHRRSGSGDSPW